MIGIYVLYENRPIKSVRPYLKSCLSDSRFWKDVKVVEHAWLQAIDSTICHVANSSLQDFAMAAVAFLESVCGWADLSSHQASKFWCSLSLYK